MWAWGSNQYGQLGDGTTQLRTTPVQVSGLSGVTAIASACDTGVALKSDGTVWALGYNGDGEFGNGTTTNSTTPVQANISGVSAIAAGCFHILALKSDGTMWTWGYNHNGQLGNGSTRPSSTPVQVTGLPAISAIGAGKSHSLAAAADGTVWAWGYNGAGQLGNDSTRQSSTPVQVLSLSGATTVAGGGNFSLATTSAGAVWAWGQNTYGQLGDGTTADRHTPVHVSGITDASAISAGSNHSLAATGAGSALDWGNNQYGQLGNGTNNNSSTPVQVSTLSGVTSQLSATYAYNGDGLRMSKTVNGMAEAFSWDLGRGIPLVLEDAGTSFIYGPANIALEQVDGSGTPTYLHQDQLGSTRLLTDGLGAVRATYTFDPYGVTVSHTGVVDTPMRFAGQYADSETGMYYLRSRYYDPVTAQFLTRDPFNAAAPAPQSLALADPVASGSTLLRPYQYGGGSPLNRTDPLGLWDIPKILDVVTGGLTAVGVTLAITAAVTTAPAWVPAAAAVAFTAATVVSIASTTYTWYLRAQGQASDEDVAISTGLTIVGLIPGFGWGSRIWRPFASAVPNIARFSPPIASALSAAQLSWDFRAEFAAAVKECMRP